MIEQEAIEYIEKHAYILDEIKDIAIKALEKQMPKVVTDIGNEERYEIYCPNCNKDLYEKYDRNEKSLYCDECGQALDWSELE